MEKFSTKHSITSSSVSESVKASSSVNSLASAFLGDETVNFFSQYPTHSFHHFMFGTTVKYDNYFLCNEYFIIPIF